MNLPRRKTRRGGSLLEVSLSTLMVGLLMVGSLSTVGASKRHENSTGNNLVSQQLAYGLMNEILQQAYIEPGGTATPTLGKETGENTGNRSLFDDVDDYHGWTASPPQDRNGNALAGATGWTNSVTVTWADATTLAATSSVNTGLKKITVTTSKGGKTYSTLTSYRSICWASMLPQPNDPNSNHSPIVVATSPDLTQKVNANLTVDGSTTSDADGDYLTYLWNFGDGTTANTATYVKKYTVAGTYTITLTVYDGKGGVGTGSLVAVISP
jgi:hypothetical protein